MTTTKHQCTQTNKINQIKEDTDTLKIAFGYKEKSNGEFREQVTKEDNSIRDDIQGVINDMRDLRNMMITLFTATIGLIIFILTVLIISIRLY